MKNASSPHEFWAKPWSCDDKIGTDTFVTRFGYIHRESRKNSVDTQGKEAKEV